MLDYDRSNFLRFLNDFPQQLTHAQKLVAEVQPRLDTGRIRNLVFAGMGGSAISGDLFIAYALDELAYPAQVNREYSLPAFVGEDTLFFATSYSGNTEETLTATEEAFKRGAQIVCISSGGELEAFSQSKGLLHMKIPGGLPPRQALGYLFFPVLFLCEKLGLIRPREEEVDETLKILNELQRRFNPNASQGHNLPNHIAQSLYHTIPVIYTAVPYLYPIPVRWRNQFNENSKIMAFSNVFPELNHNEIMGWEGPQKVNQFFRVVLLRDPEETPRNKQRVEITKGILKDKGIPILEVFAEGKSRLARMFSLIYIGDWASYYLAMINAKDPIKIDSITLLKKKLAELK
ncbi:MAG: bifunctional phosphoglucose/phosphomannose isomerase [Calditrichaeota bacterium]|nr:bifunctional phosphoglucose/phosphomannose isomerase [Calditrichota bacterium]